MQLENNKKRAAFFDLDLTITDVDSFRLFIKTYYFKDLYSMFYLPYLFFFGMLRKLRLISLKHFKERALVGLKGKSLPEIRQLGMEFFETHLTNELREKAVKRIKKHKREGDLVFIVSASPDLYVQAVCQYLNCDGYLCSDLTIEENRFTGLLNGEDCIGNEKAIRLKQLAIKYQIDLERSFAYSDHDADLMFLKSVGTRIAITPTVKLLEISNLRGWEIEYW